MENKFNDNIESIAPSASVALMAKAKEMQRTDPSIINLTAGEPDFPTPEKITDEAIRFLREGYTHYTDAAGEPVLRKAIARKLQDENAAPYSADDILVTPGGKLAIYLAIRAILNDGDEAIWLSPGWVSYPAQIKASGGLPREVKLSYDDDYKITLEVLERAVSEKTRLLILNYPNNPTGRILSREEADEIRKFLENHPNVYVLSDEIYEKIIYDGKKSVSIASFSEIFGRVIVVNGFSKCAAMTGWRIGYLACADKKLYGLIKKLFSHTMSCTSGFVQRAAAKSFECGDETELMRKSYEKRRDFLAEELNKIPGVEFKAPDGAFYAWVKFDTKKSSIALADELLQRAHIAGVPGEAYGETDKMCIRFSFAADMDLLEKFVENLKQYVTDMST